MATVSPAIGSHGHADDHSHGHHELSFVKKYVFSTDHKIIGMQFLITTLLMLMVGGALALAVRWQLAYPWDNMPVIGQLFGLFRGEGGQISPEFYTMLFTMHASVMIFLVIIPILAGAFGNFLIPLQIGADDMALRVHDGEREKLVQHKKLARIEHCRGLGNGDDLCRPPDGLTLETGFPAFPRRCECSGRARDKP